MRLFERLSRALGRATTDLISASDDKKSKPAKAPPQPEAVRTGNPGSQTNKQSVLSPNRPAPLEAKSSRDRVRVGSEEDLRDVLRELQQRFATQRDPALPIVRLTLVHALDEAKICWQYTTDFGVNLDLEVAEKVLRNELDAVGVRLLNAIHMSDQGSRSWIWGFEILASGPRATRTPICTFFVFDWASMDGDYGRQAFTAIFEACKAVASGFCQFWDGDADYRIVHRMAAKGFVSATAATPPQIRNRSSFGAYLVGMWSDNKENVSHISKTLAEKCAPAYLGHTDVTDVPDVQAFSVVVSGGVHLHLTGNIAVRDGKLTGGNNTYRVGGEGGEHEAQ